MNLGMQVHFNSISLSEILHYGQRCPSVLEFGERQRSRREVLQAAVGGGVLLAGGSLLVACGSQASPTRQSTGQPKRGGQLHAGVTGGSSSDSIDPAFLLSTVDVIRNFQLFEALVGYDAQAHPQLLLAEEFTPNADATEWTVRLRKGVTFHNGKELTAEDVIYTYKRIVNPKNPGIGATGIMAVDIANMKAVDKYTVKVPCSSPFSSLYVLQPTFNYSIVPVGFDPKNPVGTGPFRFESFIPGVQSVFTRYENYWQAGLPYVDKVTITDFSDLTSQINAVTTGAVDLINSLSASSIQAVRSGGAEVLIADGAAWTPFTMRVDEKPFNDIRVRQAFRLFVDRKQMLDVVFGGYGTIGNDLFAIQDPLYDHAIPQRTQDVDQAKYLLKQAGYDGDLTVTLTTADIQEGAVNAATVLSQQAKAAGVTVQLSDVPVSTFFGPNYRTGCSRKTCGLRCRMRRQSRKL
jgi:peptide/nickel transport system substrate-binding protein